RRTEVFFSGTCEVIGPAPVKSSISDRYDLEYAHTSAHRGPPFGAELRAAGADLLGPDGRAAGPGQAEGAAGSHGPRRSPPCGRRPAGGDGGGPPGRDREIGR